MAICRGCGATFQWGFCDGEWVPLEPVASHGDLDRAYVDENGVLRADHRDRHQGGASVNVDRLDRKVPAAVAVEGDPVYSTDEVEEALDDPDIGSRPLGWIRDRLAG